MTDAGWRPAKAELGDISSSFDEATSEPASFGRNAPTREWSGPSEWSHYAPMSRQNPTQLAEFSRLSVVASLLLFGVRKDKDRLQKEGR